MTKQQVEQQMYTAALRLQQLREQKTNIETQIAETEKQLTQASAILYGMNLQEQQQEGEEPKAE